MSSRDRRREVEQGRGRFHSAGAPLFRECGRRASWAFRHAWKQAAHAAGLPDRIPHDFRRTAAQNMERQHVPRSVAMALGGWRTESMYRRYAIASEADLRDGVRRGTGLPTEPGRTPDDAVLPLIGDISDMP